MGYQTLITLNPPSSMCFFCFFFFGGGVPARRDLRGSGFKGRVSVVGLVKPNTLRGLGYLERVSYYEFFL